MAHDREDNNAGVASTNVDDFRRNVLLGLAGGVAGLAALMSPSEAKATRVTVNPSGTPVLKIYDVTDFTGTDSQKVQAAINAATAAGGGIVYFPPGVYSLTTGVTITAPSVSLVGSGMGSILRATGAATYTAGLVFFQGAVDFFVRDLLFDMNGKNEIGGGVIAIQSSGRFQVQGCRVIGWSTWGMGLNGASDFSISDCSIERATTANTLNQCITVSSTPTAGTSTRGRITRNYFKNSGIDLCCVVCEVSHNTIEGFGFGGGITTEAHASSMYYRILNNYIAGGVGIDENVTVCLGIENWAAYSVIEGNIIVGNDGSAIDNGGWRSVIARNICFNNGNFPPWAATGAPAIVSRHEVMGGLVYSGSDSIVSGNMCFDTRAGSAKGQSHGYADQSANLVNVQIFANHFVDNRTGIADIKGIRPRFSGDILDFSDTWNIGTLVAGAQTPAKTINAPGAKLGDFVVASLEADSKGCMLSAYCNADNSIRVVLFNGTGASQAFGSNVTVWVRAAKNRKAANF